MLQVKPLSSRATDYAAQLRDSSLSDLLESLTGIVRRQYRIFIILMPCILALGVLYLFVTPASFKATGTLVIDAQKTQGSQQSMPGETVVERIQTEIAIIKSPSVSLSVIKDLHLTEDPEFVGRGGLFATAIELIQRYLGLPEQASDVSANQVLTTFESRRNVSGLGQSFIIEIDFRSSDPSKAARIVNAIAEAYFNEQLEARYQSARRTSAWLQDQIDQLRTQASDADRAVVDFKRANDIVENGNGRLMTEQQVSEMNSQLILARAAKAEAKARLERIQYLMSRDIPEASVADALHSEVITRLRNQYLEIAAREGVWEAKYGANHLATVNLRTQMAELRRGINDEMKRIAESYKSDYEIILARERSLIISLSSAVSESQTRSQAEIKVRELESKVQKYRTIYENFLNRYMDSVQQQSFPIAEARLIGPAVPPSKRSQPNTLLVLTVAAASGLLLSFSVASYRELSDRAFRTSAQIEDVLGTNCIATLASLKLPSSSPDPVRIEERPPRAPRTMVNAQGLLRYAVDSPFSPFTEGLRSLKVAVDLGGGMKSNRVIGMTSTLPKEGKSTIASNFSYLLADSGDRTILMDCDLRNPSLSRQLVSVGAAGLVDVLAGKIELTDAVWNEPSTGLYFLPAGTASKLFHTNRILASDGMKQLVDRLREMFDYVIVDFPPLLPVVDTRASTNFIDSFVYIVEWGRTKKDIVEHVLGAAPEIRERILGTILNKSDLSTMARYEGHASRYLYRKDYANYGYIDENIGC